MSRRGTQDLVVGEAAEDYMLCKTAHALEHLLGGAKPMIDPPAQAVNAIDRVIKNNHAKRRASVDAGRVITRENQ